MKRSEIIDQVEMRHNLVGFLHIDDINKLNEMFQDYYSITHADSFYNITHRILDIYDKGMISWQLRDSMLNICFKANNSFRIEAYRLDNKSLYAYDQKLQCYVFVGMSDAKTFEEINHYID